MSVNFNFCDWILELDTHEYCNDDSNIWVNHTCVPHNHVQY